MCTRLLGVCVIFRTIERAPIRMEGNLLSGNSLRVRSACRVRQREKQGLVSASEQSRRQYLTLFPDTHTEIIDEGLSVFDFHRLNVELAGAARLIDPEVDYWEKSCGGKFCEGGFYQYSGAWLFPE